MDMTVLRKILFVFRYIAYEIYYFFLGGHAMLDDLISKKNNKCPLLDGDGCVAVVTGGARGIGSALVKKLLRCNMTVIIGCRKTSSGEEKVEQIRREGVLSGEAFVYSLDLMCFKSIREFARLVTSNHSEVDLLINNAGIMFPPYQETEDGFESQWGVNFLGPTLLCHLLLPVMESSSKNRKIISPRIVNVTSCAHLAARTIDFSDINMKLDYMPSLAYAQSKLAQLMFSIELDRQLKLVDSKVSVHSVHPGIVNTDLFNGTLLKRTMPWVLNYFCKTADEGATSVFFACVSPSLDNLGGSYSSNCKVIVPGKLAQSATQQRLLFNYILSTLSIPQFGRLAN